MRSDLEDVAAAIDLSGKLSVRYSTTTSGQWFTTFSPYPPAGVLYPKTRIRPRHGCWRHGFQLCFCGVFIAFTAILHAAKPGNGGSKSRTPARNGDDPTLELARNR